MVLPECTVVFHSYEIYEISNVEAFVEVSSNMPFRSTSVWLMSEKLGLFGGRVVIKTLKAEPNAGKRISRGNRDYRYVL